MRYIEISITVPGSRAEDAADALREATDGGAWIEKPFLQADLESDADVLRDALHTVHGYVAADGDRGGTVLRARELLDGRDIGAEITARLVADEDWAEAWKEHFHVEHYGERLVVVPSWRTHVAAPRDVIVRLDPGMAFGTGQHETTRMCLEALERAVRPGARVLDVGCGSGILSIAAMKLGAAETVALDIDPICVRVTAENADANRVTVRAAEGTLGDAWPLETPSAAAFDVVVANIIARAIISMAAELVRALVPAGRLIVSGVIAERELEVRAALERAGLAVDVTRAMGEWRCIEGVRA